MGKSGIVSWKSPSNIAMVKYWGKKDFQLPCNPSISMTLTNCYSITSIVYMEKTGLKTPVIRFSFEDKPNVEFEEKINSFIVRTTQYLPQLSTLQLTVNSRNSFPYGAGIASSASAYSSIALCLCSIEEKLSGVKQNESDFYQKASFIARLGSGSACRSLYKGWVLWGLLNKINDSSNDYAISIDHKVSKTFQDYYDAILLVNSNKKSVSSSFGHQLFESNPFKEAKISKSIENTNDFLDCLKSGDEDTFMEIIEKEASFLHASFLTSDPPFILINPETIHVIQKLVNFRKESGLKFCFTLDAGPNIHLLYARKIRNQMIEFIESELINHCENKKWIDDKIGTGPEIIESN